MNNTSFKQIPASLTLPQERKAEKALLFGLLASRKSLPEIAFRIRPEMFTHPDIALAIEAYLNLHEKGEGTDILSVEKEIRRLSPERAGQLPDLFELARQDGYMEIGGEFVRQHCQYIREAFVARQLILRCHELAHKASADDRDTQKLISELGTVADELGEQLSLTHEIPDMPTATAEAMARVREIRERVARGGTAGIHTGLGGLDRLMGGLRTGSLHVFAARPGMGKTAFALFMAVNAAKQGVPVCVYSLEMSREQLIFRMLGQIANVEPSKIDKGTATEEEMRALEEASLLLKELPICINQRSDIQIDEIRCDISLRRRQGKCSLAIIAVRGVRRQPASPTRRHGPGRGIPPERERRAGASGTGGYPRLPLLPHPPSGFPPSHGHRRHQRGVGRDRPPLLPAGRVPEAWGAIRGDGYTDGGITAGNVCRHRPEKRSGSGTEEESRRPHARPATRKGVTAFLPHAP